MINWILNYKQSSKKLTIPNVKNFIVAKWRGWFHDDWETRQFTWREMKVLEKSPSCLKDGQCICLCPMPDKLWEDFACTEKAQCYPEWMNEYEWKLFEPYTGTDMEIKFLNFYKEIKEINNGRQIN